MQRFSHTIGPEAIRRTIVLAGLAGAAAEVVWIALFCSFTPLTSGEVLRQITASVAPTMLASAWAPALGLALHFALGIVVAYAFALIIWRPFALRRGAGTTLLLALIALAAIWAFNFFVLLPAMNAAFATLMPYSVTLVSKLLFGVAMAATLSFNVVEERIPGVFLAHH